MDVLQMWLGSIALSLVGVYVGVFLLRLSVTIKTHGLPAVFASLGLGIPIFVIGGATLALAGKAAYDCGVRPEHCLPLSAMGGWAYCWARGLERYADDRLGGRSISTPQAEISLLPFGALVFALLAGIPHRSPTDGLLVGTFLLPFYLAFSCWLHEKAYTTATLDRRVVRSEALRHAAICASVGVAIVGLLRVIPKPIDAWALLPTFWFPAYFLGIYSEVNLRRRLNERFKASQPMAVPPSLPQVAVPPADNLPTVTVGRSTSQKP